MPSGDHSVTPATLGASGHSGLQRVFLSASARKRSSPERLTTSKKVFRTARSAVPCRSSTSGHRASSSKHTRGQSRETGSLSAFSVSLEASAKCISMGPAHCRERIQDSVRVASASIQRGVSRSGGPRAGSGNGTRSNYSFEEGGHRGGPSSCQRVRVLQPILHRSEEGWGLASNSRSTIVEPLSQETQVQDAYYQASRGSNQVRGLVCDYRSKGRLLPYIHPSSTQEVPEVCFRGQCVPISGSSVRSVDAAPLRL